MSQQPFKIVKNREKKMPCNIEAEQAVIGSILVTNDIYDEISPIIDSQKFLDPIHAKIFETIENLIAKGLLANPITLKNHFENNEGLKELGGQEYLIKIKSSQIDLGKEINKIGSYEAKINLHAEILANIHIEVVKEKEEN